MRLTVSPHLSILTNTSFLAVLKLIEYLCLCQLPATREQVETWQGIVDENLVHVMDDIRVRIRIRV